MLVQQRKPLHQDGVALLGGLGAPGRPGLLGRHDGGVRVGRAQVGHVDQLQARGRVAHIEARGARDPFTADQRVGLQQAGIGQGRQR
jgi:hypothetical protein